MPFARPADQIRDELVEASTSERIRLLWLQLGSFSSLVVPPCPISWPVACDNDNTKSLLQRLGLTLAAPHFQLDGIAIPHCRRRRERRGSFADGRPHAR